MIKIDRSGDYPVACVTVSACKQAIVNFSDIHVGHANFNERALDKTIKWAIDNDALCIAGGDWMENATKHSVGAGVIEQVLTPQEQIDFLIEKFKPLKGRFIGGYSGNHEDRTYKETGIDPSQIVFNALEIPFFPIEFWAVLSTRAKTGRGKAYSIYAVHSDSAHKTSGLAVNKVQGDWAWIHADIKMKSHDHQLHYSWGETIQIDKNNRKVRHAREYIVLTGSCLNRAGSYATKKPHRPGTIGQIGLWLDFTRGGYSVKPEYIME